MAIGDDRGPGGRCARLGGLALFLAKAPMARRLFMEPVELDENDIPDGGLSILSGFNESDSQWRAEPRELVGLGETPEPFAARPLSPRCVAARVSPGRAYFKMFFVPSFLFVRLGSALHFSVHTTFHLR